VSEVLDTVIARLPLAEHIVTAADLIDNLGGISPARIRLKPAPGTATEQDMISIARAERRRYELVDGTLVEKPMGAFEGRLALVLGGIVDLYVYDHDLGVVFGADSTMRILGGLVRIPDMAYVSWSRLPERKVPHVPVPDLVPDIAALVLSEGNTDPEMARKLHEYFSAGVRQVWIIDPEAREIRVFTSETRSRLYKDGDTLRGGRLLPGFALALTGLFDRAEYGR
jgi:Uma2 family endonuclease